MEAIQLAFDYQQLDTETRTIVQQEDKEFDQNITRGNGCYTLAGRNLGRIQEALRYKHPGFVEYLRAKQVPQNTAYKLIHIGQMFTESVNISSVEALALLAAPSTPDEARQEAIERAQNGETITHSAAKEIVNNHKPGVDPDTIWFPTGNGFESASGHKLLDEHLDAALADESKPVCLECGQVYDGPACPDCHQNGSGFNYKRDTKSARPADIYTPQGYDACQTPPYAVDPLLPYLPEGWNVWEPAAGEGYLEGALYDSGFSVTSSDILTGQNFFEYEPDNWDCIITNPPFSIKYKFMEHCYQLGKPFALLMPVEVLGTESAAILFEAYGVEVIFIRPRINFKMPHKGWDGGGAQFPVAWFTWGLNVGKQMTFAKVTADNAEID